MADRVVMLGYFRAALIGEFGTVGRALAGIIGRPPLTMRNLMQAVLRGPARA